MVDIHVRPATVADAPAVTTIHCSDIVRWRRWQPDGEEEFARFEDLSIYERWLNGGPWMDATTCAPHLERLTEGGAGIALVAEAGGQLLAEAEAFIGDEPPPFGRNLNLSVLYVRRGQGGRGLGRALMDELIGRARAEGCETFLVTHAEAPEFYARHALSPHSSWRRARVPVKTSRAQYFAEPLPDSDYAAVSGWAMPIGRYQSARQEWETKRPGAEPDFAEWRSLRTERWRLVVRGRPAALILDESPRERGWADAHLWTPAGLARQHLAAARDLAARAGFSGLLCFVAEASLPLLGPEMETDGYKQEVWWRRLSSGRRSEIG